MRRYLGIFLLALLLCGCSAKRQLANLLKRHPELRTVDSLHLVNIKVPIPGVTNAIPFPKIKDDPCNCDSLLREAIKDGIETTAGNAKAAIMPTDSGLVLQAMQTPDTILVRDTIRVPQYIIKTAPRDETNSEIFFRVLGYITAGICLLVLILFILKKFILK